MFTEKQKGVLALVVLAWVFATMAIFARYLGTEFSLFEQTYLRIGVAFFLGSLFFAARIRWRKFLCISRQDALLLIARSVSLYLGVVFFTESILHTTLGNASLIAALPLLPLFGYVMVGEKVKKKTLVFVLLGFCGAAIISFQEMQVGLRVGYGEVMAFLSVLAFDFSYVARRWQSTALNNYETTVAMFFIGSLFLFVASLLFQEGLPTVSQFSWAVLVTLLLAGFFNVLNLALTNYGFEKVKVVVAGNLLMLEVVFALAYGWLLFQEVPTGREILGGLCIIVSIFAINRIEGE